MQSVKVFGIAHAAGHGERESRDGTVFVLRSQSRVRFNQVESVDLLAIAYTTWILQLCTRNTMQALGRDGYKSNVSGRSLPLPASSEVDDVTVFCCSAYPCGNGIRNQIPHPLIILSGE